MATKLSRIKELAEQTTKQLTASPENWTSYLDTASGLYRYPFSDQLLIYAQRPDATACASIELWNQKLNRWIKKGSKGIALIDDSGRKTELKYVFDIADTQDGWYNPRRPYLWKMQQHHLPAVTEELSVNYDIPVGGLPEMLMEIAGQSAEEFILENRRDIVYTIEDSYLEGLDEYNVEVLFRQTLTSSIAYNLMKRCGLDTNTYFTNEDFEHIHNFNTLDTATALGTATSTLSEQILMNIGRTVRDFDRAFYQKQQLNQTREEKPTERSKQHEQSKQRTGIHTERGLPDSQPDTGTRRRGNRKVRNFTERLSEGTQENSLQSIATERGTGQPLSRDTSDRRPENTPDDNAGIGETARTGQSPKTPEMDTTHEQPGATGGGNSPERTHLQLKNATIDSAESDSQTLSDFLMPSPVSLKAVHELLRTGSNRRNSMLRICSFYKRQHPAEENIAFLKQEYQTGGKGLRVDGEELSAWFDESGIALAAGNTALQSPDNLLITWEQVDSGIRELLNSGQYLPQIELDIADTNEITETASMLWNLYRDSDHNIPEEWNVNVSGYPDSVAEISRRLSQADTLKEIVQKVQTDLADGQINFRRWSKPDHVLQAVTDLQREPLNFIANEAFTSEHEHEQFITQDEVDAYFTRGSSFSQGKFRIYSYFLHEHTSKEKADFLKNEYGTGGGTHALSGADNSYEDHGSKGIRLSRGIIGTPFDKIKLSWNDAVKRIDKLISQERYMTEKELVYIPEYEKEMLATKIYHFFYNAPENIVRPYPFGAEYNEALKTIRPQLDSPDQLAGIIESMHPVYESLKEDDRDYQGKRDIYHAVISFQNGTYTLFPTSPVEEKASVHANEPIAPDSKEMYRQLSLFPTEQEQKESISKAEKEQYPAFNVDLLADALRYDGMMHIKKPEIKAYFSEHASAKKRADFLKTAYNTEFSLFDVGIPEQRIGYHVEEHGLYLWEGNYLSRTSGTLYTWNELHEKITDLLESNSYLEKPLNERAASLSYRELYQAYLPFMVDIVRKDAIYSFLRDRDTDYDEAKTVLKEYVMTDILDSLRLEHPIFCNAYVTLEHFADWMVEDILEYTYQDMKTGQRDMVTIHGSDKDAPDWVKNADTAIATAAPTAINPDETEKEPKIERTVQDIFNEYAPLVISKTFDDEAYQNMRTKFEDDENAKIECKAAIKRIVNDLMPEHMELYKCYYDFPKFHKRLDDYVFKKTYSDFLKFHNGTYKIPGTKEKNTYAHQNFRALNALVPQIFSGESNYIKLHADGYMDLEVNKLGDNRISMTHFYDRNGDLFHDPDMEMVFDLKEETISARTYQQDGLGVYQTTENENLQVIRAKLEKQLNGFLRQWLSNIKAQGYEIERMQVHSLGEEIELVYGDNRNVKHIDGTKQAVQHYVDTNDIDYNYESPTPALDASTEPETSVQKDPEYLLGQELEIADRRYAIDQVNEAAGTVSLQDITFQNATGFPIFREEPIAFVKELLQETKEKPAPPFTESESIEERPSPASRNYKIKDESLGAGGQKTKYGYNVSAIRTLKIIEAENRQATPEEQDILAKYVGWGGLAQVFDKNNGRWEKEYAELKELLTDREYTSARSSTLNAHYTSPVVIKSMYEALGKMGFRTGNILEPAMGVGNFFGMLPENMAKSKLYGVEIDSISGRIARQLYPKADIQISGFEKTDYPDSFFDVAIGNIPFGSYKVPDKEYDKQNLYIHDYFIAKTLDKVRPGGIVAFVTSKGTLDKTKPDFRKYLACRAELVGAVRLPNTAFKDNAGTEVTSDILFFQKRDRMIDIEPDWVHLDQTNEGVPVNSYFADNPHMMLGTMVQGEEYSLYGNDTETACIPFADSELNLSEQLTQAMNHVYTQMDEINLDDLPVMEKERESIPADPEVRNYSFCIRDDEIYYRENSRMYRQDLTGIPEHRVRHLIKLRDTVNTLIHYQMEDYSDFEIKQKQRELGSLYDDFTKKYGLISSRGNSLAFSDDPSYYLLCSLEVLDDEGNFERKADMFHKRTIKKKEVITHVDTASEALAVSLSEKACVDLGYMHSLSGIDHEQIVKDLEGVIFRLPAPDADVIPLINTSFVTADEYLSGNVREKLQEAREAMEASEQFRINVAALERAQPKDLEAHEIDVRLGSTWIEQAYIQQFTHELLQTPDPLKDSIHVHYSALTSRWNMEGKSVDRQNVLANESYGTGRANAYRIIEDTLNLRDVRIYDTIEDDDGKERRVLNRKETMLAQQKQELIKQKFKDWIFDDSDRRDYLVRKYNTKFNCIKPREYDGSHITFNGMNPDIYLEKHQVNAVARGLYGGKTLLAHEVGAGKTYEMVAIAMESKRLGLSQKALFAVPNHLIEQTASEFLRLYPSANILVARKKDFETVNRKKFCARIATGDYDAVIMGHSQFEKIPISRERQKRLLQEQISEIVDGIVELIEQKGERFSIKDMERTKKSLEAKLERLNDTSRKDDTVTFEQLGIDRLIVDESHNYKNLFLVTKMRNVAGLSTSDAQKSSDLFMKCRYIDEVTNGKGIVFATGTPISNSMTELYTVMRYLMYDYLIENDLLHFDAWASMFGETVTAMELAPEGNGYRSRTRFARFFNLPELMNIFKEVADIKMADELNLDRPDAVYQNIVAEPTEHQKELIAGLSDRAAVIHNGAVDPSQDNMLKITTDGRKIGLDQRLINPLLPDDENSKTNLCMRNIYRIWEDNKDTKAAQLVFCDFSTPSKDKFNVYDDIREKLIEKGIPENEIAYIHDANTDVKKKELFAKVRSGQVRVLFGSTQKMGAGTNVQDRLIAIHDLDAPWRPADLSQRAGRIVRRGNMFKKVHIFRYVTEDSFDSYLYQTLENKQKFISQIMTSKTPLRSCEDMDETALNFAEIKALCAGNPLIKEKMELETDLVKLKVLRANYQSQRYRLEDKLLKYYPQAIQTSKALITGYGKDIEHLRTAACKDADGFSPMTLFAREYTDKEQAGKALLTACKKMNGTQAVKIGTYRGFEIHLSFEGFDQKHVITLKHDQRYKVELGDDVFGNITRLNNALEGIADRLHKRRQELESLHQQQENTKAELDKPFDKEEEFQAKNARYIELDALLNIETDKLEQTAETNPHSADEMQTEAPSESPVVVNTTPAAGRTSVLARLEMEKANVKSKEQQRSGGHKQPAMEAVM